jgi:hypothetical protein
MNEEKVKIEISQPKEYASPGGPAGNHSPQSLMGAMEAYEPKPLPIYI